MFSKKKLRLAGLIFAILSVYFAVASTGLAVLLKFQRERFFLENELRYQEFTILLEDRVRLEGIYYVNRNLETLKDQSVPSILMINGINSRKESYFDRAFQLAKFGYAIFTVDQRGHGFSTGPSGFLSKEVDDMIAVLNHVSNAFQFANTTHFGLLAFSYGGGIGTMLQARDDRIHASVIFHPLSTLEGLMERIPIQNLLGTTPSIQDLNDIHDAYDILNPNNTKNLLLIQGLNDVLIIPEETIQLYNLLDGNIRSDIELELRPNLDHVMNEKDEISLKNAIIWFEHFYHDPTLNINDRTTEISSIELADFNYPDYFFPEIFIIVSAILLFMGLSIIIVDYRIIPFWKNLPYEKGNNVSLLKQNKYKRMIFYRTIVYLTSVLGVSIIFFFINHSLIYGYYIAFSIVGSLLMLFFPSELYRNWKDEMINSLKKGFVPFVFNLVIIIVSVLYFLIFYNLNSVIMKKSPLPFVNTSLVPYFFLGITPSILDFLYLRDFKPKHSWILVVIRPISLLIFFIFVPLPPFPLLGGFLTHVLFIILMGVVLYYIRQLVLILSKFYKNSVALYFFVLTPFIILFIKIFFRII